MNISLSERVAIITGANQGLGEAIALSFVQAGASVFLCARDDAKLLEVQKKLRGFCNPGQRVEVMRVDVSNQQDIEKFYADALNLFPKIHILVNNAGVLGAKGHIDEVDWDEWVRAININLLGSVLMAKTFLPHFKKNHCGKIIQLSGGGATAPSPFMSAYAASKAGIVRFMETLAMEVKDFGIDVNSVAPGALNTRMLDDVLEAGPEKLGNETYEKFLKQKNDRGASLKRAADFCTFLASSASDGISGKLISAVWDPWEDLNKHLDDLQNSDVYTLRRIVPKDRGMDWGQK